MSTIFRKIINSELFPINTIQAYFDLGYPIWQYNNNILLKLIKKSIVSFTQCPQQTWILQKLVCQRQIYPKLFVLTFKSHPDQTVQNGEKEILYEFDVKGEEALGTRLGVPKDDFLDFNTK